MYLASNTRPPSSSLACATNSCHVSGNGHPPEKSIFTTYAKSYAPPNAVHVSSPPRLAGDEDDDERTAVSLAPNAAELTPRAREASKSTPRDARNATDSGAWRSRRGSKSEKLGGRWMLPGYSVSMVTKGYLVSKEPMASSSAA
nr:unnamed protein product [Digitaria exilis]